MKPTRHHLALFTPIFCASTVSVAHATAYQWDVNGATAGLGGTGAWNTSSTFWDLVGSGTDNGTDATVAYTFTNADIALFGGTAGTATLGTGVTVNGLTFNTAGYTITGNTLTLDGTTPTIAAASGVTTTISSNLAGTAGFTKNGAGTLTISTNTSNTITGTVNINAGKLTLLNTTTPGANTNKLATTSVVALGSGTLEYVAQDAGYNQIQDLAGLTVNAGSSSVIASRTGLASSFLRWTGNMTRFVGGTVDISPTNAFIGTLGTTTNTNGMAGGFATLNGNTWAVYGLINNTAITGLATYGTAAASTATTNVDVTASDTLAGAPSVANSLRFNTGAATTLTLNGAATLTSGGILVTSAVGNFASTISGGTSLAGAAGADLIVHQHNTANTLTIASNIVDNTSATGLTKSGAGELIVSGTNGYTGNTYANAGILTFANPASFYGSTGGAVSIGNAQKLIVNSGGIASFNVASGNFDTTDINTLLSNSTASVGFKSGSSFGFDTTGVAGGTYTLATAFTDINGGLNSIGLAKTGTGTLALTNAGNTYTGATTVYGGTLSASSNSNLGAVATGAGITLNGGTLQATETFALDNGGANKRAITLGAAGGGFDVASTKTLTVSGAFSGTGALTKSGNGTLALTGTASYTGATTIIGGVLTVSQPTGFLSATTVNNTGTLTLAGTASWGHAASNALTLNDGATLDKTNTGFDAFDSSDITINGTVAINITNNGASNQLFIGGTTTGLKGSGTINVTNTGTATTGLTLRTNAGTFTGAMNVTGGALNIGNGSALVLQNTNLTLTGAKMTMDNSAFATGGATNTSVKSLSGNSASSVVLGAQTLTLGVNDGTGGNFAGAISGTGALIKTGTGTQALTGISTYTGATTVNGGTLALSGADGTLGNTAITLATGGTLKLDNAAAPLNKTTRVSDSAAITLAGGTLQFSNDAAADVDFSEIVGTVSVSPISGGTITSSQAASDGTSTLTLSGLIGGPNFSGTGLGVDARNKIAITGKTAGALVGTFNTTGLAVYDTTLGVTDATLTPVPFAGTIADGASTNIHLTGGASGDVALGAATTTVNTIFQNQTAATVIDTASKTLRLGTDGGILLPTGKASLNIGAAAGDGTLTLAGAGTLNLFNNDATSVLTINAAVADNGTVNVVTGGPGKVVLAGVNTYTGTTALNAAITEFSGGTQTLPGAVSGLGSLVKSGGGTLTLSNNSNSYSGNTVVSGGTLKFTGTTITSGITTFSGAGTVEMANASLAASGATPNVTFGSGFTGQIKITENFGAVGIGGGTATTGVFSSNLGSMDIAGTKTLSINGGTVKVDALTGAGNIANGAVATNAPAVLIVGANGGTGIFSGNITSASAVNGAINLRKEGAGTQTLSGTGNTYTGTTTVSAGTLVVNGTKTGAGAVTVQSGATLGGSGSVSGATTLQAGAFVAPGASTGTLTLGSATLAGTYQCELDATTGDRLTVTGALTISPGAAITISNLATPTASSYTILSYGSLVNPLPTITPPPGYQVVHDTTAKQVKLVSGYGSWAATNAPTGTPNDDYDGDGVSNGVEWVLGGLATTNDLNKLPTVNASGADLVFTFVRNDAAWQSGDTTTQIEVGTTLGAWPGVYNVGIDTASSSAGVTVTNNGTTDTVTLTVAKGADAKKFARLNVTVAP